MSNLIFLNKLSKQWHNENDVVVEMIKSREEALKEIVHFLNNTCGFHEYSIHDLGNYGKINKVGLHIVLNYIHDDLEYYLEDALNQLERDGYNKLFIYV